MWRSPCAVSVELPPTTGRSGTNFVFGLGNWDNVCTKASGEWLFKSMKICKWMGEDVPWAGEDRAKISAPQGRII